MAGALLADLRFGLTASQRLAAVAVLQTVVERIDRVAVFGSRAEGRQRPNSDLDLVLFGPVDERDCDRLGTLFQDSALPFSVDVKSYDCLTYAPLRRHIDQAARAWLVRVGGRLTEVPASVDA